MLVHSFRFALAALVLTATASDALAQGKSRTQPVSMTIVGGYGVHPDLLGSVYTDYRASGDPSCVEVSVDQVFVRFNRHHPDSSTNPFEYCENATGYGAPKRQYFLEIDNAEACNELLSAVPVNDPDPFAVWTGPTTCRVHGSDKPRIRAANAFKARLNTRTDVTFLILSYDSTIAYEVQGTALISGDASVRTLTNGASVTLIRNAQSGDPGATIASFALPFKLVFTKVPAIP